MATPSTKQLREVKLDSGLVVKIYSDGFEVNDGRAKFVFSEPAAYPQIKNVLLIKEENPRDSIKIKNPLGVLEKYYFNQLEQTLKSKESKGRFISPIISPIKENLDYWEKPQRRPLFQSCRESPICSKRLVRPTQEVENSHLLIRAYPFTDGANDVRISTHYTPQQVIGQVTLPSRFGVLSTNTADRLLESVSLDFARQAAEKAHRELQIDDSYVIYLECSGSIPLQEEPQLSPGDVVLMGYLATKRQTKP